MEEQLIRYGADRAQTEFVYKEKKNAIPEALFEEDEQDDMWVKQRHKLPAMGETNVDERHYNFQSMDNEYKDIQIRTLVQTRGDFLGKLAQEREYHTHKFKQGLKGTSADSIRQIKTSLFKQKQEKDGDDGEELQRPSWNFDGIGEEIKELFYEDCWTEDFFGR